MSTLFRGNSVEQDQRRISFAQPSQDKPQYCYQSSKFLVVIILFGVFSMALSCTVWYLVLGAKNKCQCQYTDQYMKGYTTSQNFTVVFNDLKTKLQKDIDDLTNKIGNLSRTVSDNNETSNEFYESKYQETAKTLGRLYNQTEKKVARLFQQTNEQVDMIRELSRKPNCFFHQRKQSKNSTLLTVQVPKSAEDRITVVVTCSTTLQNTADVRYMVPSTNTDSEYICYCKNNIKKQTDCVAYYWQCRL